MRVEGQELRRIARGLAYMLELIDKDIDRLTCRILRHEFRLKIQGTTKKTEPS